MDESLQLVFERRELTGELLVLGFHLVHFLFKLFLHMHSDQVFQSFRVLLKIRKDLVVFLHFEQNCVAFEQNLRLNLHFGIFFQIIDVLLKGLVMTHEF